MPENGGIDGKVTKLRATEKRIVSRRTGLWKSTQGNHLDSYNLECDCSHSRM